MRKQKKKTQKEIEKERREQETRRWYTVQPKGAGLVVTGDSPYFTSQKGNYRVLRKGAPS